jgi:hypothetical protein
MFGTELKGYNMLAPQEECGSHFMMQNTIRPIKEFYSETEAAEVIGISVPRLHMLLDAHVFNDGSSRPESLSFTSSDMVLLGFWQRSTPNPKVVRMPKRS